MLVEKVVEMKIILSRKGFDSKYGGCPSPIMPDGAMLSFPIPSDTGVEYSCMSYKEQKYSEIWKQLCPNRKDYREVCHLDPDIREGVRMKLVDNWKPAFGQCGAAQTHLENKGVTYGDLFMFFGWFRQTENRPTGQLTYKKDSPGIHAIYGYIQVGEMLQGDRIQEYPWHPHADQSLYAYANNTLYTPAPELIIGNYKTGLPGYGTLEYASRLVLTKEGMSRSRWNILDWFNEVEISHHNKESIKNDYFQSAGIGQEFVISANEEAMKNVTDWVKAIIVGD